MNAPLLVTADPSLLDDLLRLSAAAGVVLDVAHDPGSAMRQWAAAPMVLVGPDLVDPLAELSPSRRSDVFLVSVGEPDYRAAVALGATDVVSLPDAETWLVETLSDVGDGGARSALTIGFVGGSGGIGATTLATATAAVAARTCEVAIVDLDPLGPGVENVAGIDESGVTWHDLAGSRGRLGSRALRDSLPQRDGLAVLGWGGRPTADTDEIAVREALAAARRGHDLLVLDLPRHAYALDEAISRCDHLVLVAGCSLMGAACAVRVLESLPVVPGAVHLVARTGVGVVQPDSLADALGLELLAVLAQQRGLDEQLDLGLGPLHARRGGVARAAGDVLAGLTA